MSDRIYEWRQVLSGATSGFEEEPNTQTFVVSDVFAGWTLERTLLYVEVDEASDSLGFPPEPANPWAVGLYHARNGVGHDLEPGIQDWETDWVAYGVPSWLAQFGTVSGPDSNLMYGGVVQVDVKSRRAILEDNPTVTLAYGPPGGTSINPGTRLRQARIRWTARFLYSHPA